MKISARGPPFPSEHVLSITRLCRLSSRYSIHLHIPHAWCDGFFGHGSLLTSFPGASLLSHRAFARPDLRVLKFRPRALVLVVLNTLGSRRPWGLTLCMKPPFEHSTSSKVIACCPKRKNSFFSSTHTVSSCSWSRACVLAADDGIRPNSNQKEFQNNRGGCRVSTEGVRNRGRKTSPK